jgi:hypothetical protein
MGLLSVLAETTCRQVFGNDKASLTSEDHLRVRWQIGLKGIDLLRMRLANTTRRRKEEQNNKEHSEDRSHQAAENRQFVIQSIGQCSNGQN